MTTQVPASEFKFIVTKTTEPYNKAVDVQKKDTSQI